MVDYTNESGISMMILVIELLSGNELLGGAWCFCGEWLGDAANEGKVRSSSGSCIVMLIINSHINH